MRIACDAVLFDFFGTLVDYSPSRTEQGYDRTHAVLRSLGCAVGQDEWLARWEELSAALDAEAEVTGVEFSMDQAVAALLDEVVGRAEPEAIDRVRTSYIAEWCAPVTAVDGARTVLEDLATDHRVAIVSNTHDHDMVPALVDELGFAPHLDEVVLSVDEGVRKPFPAIYAAAAARLDTAPGACLFVGDSPGPDLHGPTRAGMRALLIDPDGRAAVEPERRVASVRDVPHRLLRRNARRAGRAGRAAPRGS